jgi:uncharacterized integral membrane protein
MAKNINIEDYVNINLDNMSTPINNLQNNQQIMDDIMSQMENVDQNNIENFPVMQTQVQPTQFVPNQMQQMQLQQMQQMQQQLNQAHMPIQQVQYVPKYSKTEVLIDSKKVKKNSEENQEENQDKKVSTKYSNLKETILVFILFCIFGYNFVDMLIKKNISFFNTESESPSIIILLFKGILVSLIYYIIRTFLLK